MIFMKNKYLDLTVQMTLSEFRLRDQGTLLGFFWTLLHPLLLFLILNLLFIKWMGKFVEHYPLYLLVGIVQWNFFASATSYSLSSLIRRAELVKNFTFPREIIVVSSVLTVFLSHLFELLILTAFLLLSGATFTPLFFLVPLIVLVQLILVISISLPLSALCVYYRDIERIWGLIVTAGFFLTPIFYSLSAISEQRRLLLLLNPMTHIITASRSCLIYNNAPNFSLLGIILLLSLLILFIGFKIFRKMQRKFAEIL